MEPLIIYFFDSVSGEAGSHPVFQLRFGLKGIAVNLVTPNDLYRVQEACSTSICILK